MADEVLSNFRPEASVIRDPEVVQRPAAKQSVYESIYLEDPVKPFRLIYADPELALSLLTRSVLRNPGDVFGVLNDKSHRSLSSEMNFIADLGTDRLTTLAWHLPRDGGSILDVPPVPADIYPGAPVRVRGTLTTANALTKNGFTLRVSNSSVRIVTRLTTQTDHVDRRYFTGGMPIYVAGLVAAADRDQLRVTAALVII